MPRESTVSPKTTCHSHSRRRPSGPQQVYFTQPPKANRATEPVDQRRAAAPTRSRERRLVAWVDAPRVSDGVLLAQVHRSDEEGGRLLAASRISWGRVELALGLSSYLGSAGAFLAAALAACASAGVEQQ